MSLGDGTDTTRIQARFGWMQGGYAVAKKAVGDVSLFKLATGECPTLPRVPQYTAWTGYTTFFSLGHTLLAKHGLYNPTEPSKYYRLTDTYQWECCSHWGLDPFEEPGAVIELAGGVICIGYTDRDDNVYDDEDDSEGADESDYERYGVGYLDSVSERFVRVCETSFICHRPVQLTPETYLVYCVSDIDMSQTGLYVLHVDLSALRDMVGALTPVNLGAGQTERRQSVSPSLSRRDSEQESSYLEPSESDTE
ncbi:hypothetical protein KIPB_002978 [Kipferlia bialata]|uniref:Uncharacterized protein n=1 Tax=Kipferlia bialata TaxID=797122 RepID=A0A9K3CRK3_9EUKA|nr:hypothetical protein KIPB_002978 [Kipferlia bialata]|eukprot:g2978.t1